MKGRIEKKELNQLLAEDRDLLDIIVEQTVQPVFKAKMEEALPGGQKRRGRALAELPSWLLQPYADHALPINLDVLVPYFVRPVRAAFVLVQTIVYNC